MKAHVELIYDRDCPNVAEARAALLEAFAGTGVPARWIEWQRDAADSPEYVRQYGSPTILVEGRDVGEARPGEPVDCCRLSADRRYGFRRAPSAAKIAAALHKQANGHSGAKGILLGLPGVGTLLAPVGVCPACWPVYTSLLALAGLSFLSDARYLLPIAIALTALALIPLAYRAWQSRRYGPLSIAGAGATGALIGKFVVGALPLLYAGLALLVGASIWNLRRPRSPMTARCEQCPPHPALISGNVEKGNEQ